MITPTKYPRKMVVLHWVIAVLVFLGLMGGAFFVSELKNDDPAKIGALMGHMIIGGLLLVLMLARLIIRLRSVLPPHANTPSMLAHWGLYALIFAMAGSGIAMSVAVGLPDIVFLGKGALPETFDDLTARTVHGLVANALIALVAVHIAAAIWHAVVKKDGIMQRMSFRR